MSAGAVFVEIVGCVDSVAAVIAACASTAVDLYFADVVVVVIAVTVVTLLSSFAAVGLLLETVTGKETISEREGKRVMRMSGEQGGG